MPFCPKCGGEYRPGFTRCVDCGVELVEYLPEMPETKQAGEAPVIVYETHSQAEADVLRSKLEFFGVSAVLSGEMVDRSLSGIPATAYGPIRILVPAHQAEESRRILTEAEDQP